jgi:choline-sulfatase
MSSLTAFTRGHSLIGAHPCMKHLRPNILFLFSDQHSAFTDLLNVGSRPRTPNLDAMRRCGADFQNAYCNSPICVPSRMSFMSARLPSQIGGFNNDDRLSPSDPTIAYGLRAAGYETVLCGKMHFLPPDMHKGFDRVIFGEPEAELFEGMFLGEPGVPGWHATGRIPLYYSGPGRQGFSWFDEEVASRASDFLNNRPADSPPFFLTAGFILPHNPYVCDPDLFQYHFDRIDPALLAKRIALKNAHAPYLDIFLELNKLGDIPLETHRRALAAYFGLCEQLDANIGKVIDSLRASPFADKTLVVYSSDHGEICARHGLWYKSAVTEDSIRVPLIATGPGILPGPRKRVVSLVDLAVTFCAAGGAEPPPEACGRSFLDCLDNPDLDDDGEMICESNGRAGAGPLWAMRKGNMKFTFCHTPRMEILCNLDSDPDEEVNLLQNPDSSRVVEDFRRHRAYWNPEIQQRNWEIRRDARSYIERVNPDREIPLLPPPVRCPPGTNCFKPPV